MLRDVDNKPVRHVPHVVSNTKLSVPPVAVILLFPLFPVGIAQSIAAIVFRLSVLLAHLAMTRRAIVIVTVEREVRGVMVAATAATAVIAGSFSSL